MTLDNLLMKLYFGLLLVSLAIPYIPHERSMSATLELALVTAFWAALSLALSAHIIVRRLRYVPVEAETFRKDEDGGLFTYWWRYEFEGEVYKACDADLSWRIRFWPSSMHCTVYVDPTDPSRMLPPSWRERLGFYLVLCVVCVCGAITLAGPELGWFTREDLARNPLYRIASSFTRR